MKVSVLWSSLASYSVAFLKELALSQDCEIQLIFNGSTAEAPYASFDLSFCSTAANRSENPEIDIESAVRNFAPDCILMASWNFPEYMRISRKLRRKGVFVVSTIDHQWNGTLKQWLGVFTSRWFLKPSIDSFLVAGDRQAHFARKLGYEDILYGLYAATVEDFTATVPLSRRNAAFLFIGRLVPEKGIENLIRAYRLYRQQCKSPWDLMIAGAGHLEHRFRDMQGVKLYGFMQPVHLSKLMQSARALIMPSKWEPWGVVIHEAAAAGLPIIATYKCGAVTDFVRDGINGFVVQSRPDAIKNAMLKMTFSENELLEDWGRASRILAELWTPKKLASYFVRNIKPAVDRVRSSSQR